MADRLASMRLQWRVEEETVEELKRRLRETRWPWGVTDHGGVPLAEMQEVLRYWREEFDWRAQERELNQFPQFRENDIHFIHLQSARRDAVPLLLLHGWPGSFVEFRHVIPLLRDDFHLVIPSLPGYAFSPLPSAGGFSNARIAEAMLELMSFLSYEHFAIQGGDWGAGIGTWMSIKAPSRVLGLHLNYIPGSYHPAGPPDEEFFRARDEWSAEFGAYGHVQKTRPLTLGYALSDSPAGLAAWIYEKFVEWSDPETRPSLDDILTNISIYWFTNSIASSMRLYLESAPLRIRERVSVPTAILHCHLEAPFPPRSWIERGYHVVRWTDVPKGGHFAALEVPEVFAEDVRGFLGVRRR